MGILDVDRGKTLSGNYPYLNEKDSNLFDMVKDSKQTKDMCIKQLLIEKAESCRAAHCNSNY